MKLKTRKNLLTVMLSVLCAVMLFCSVGLLSGGANGAKTAKAASTTIGEIATGSGANTFSGEKLAELYDAILGSDYKYTGTYNKVKDKLDKEGTPKVGSGVSTKALSATELGEIYVTFGDIQWQVAYLTTSRTGDLILDLMRKDNDGNNVFASGGGYTKWNDTSYAVISNIYATSYIRSVILGIGSTYYNFPKADTTTNYSVGTTAPRGTYSRFISGDLSTYVEAPSAIDYQEKENCVEAGLDTINYSSDAYGTPSVENYYVSGNVNTDYLTTNPKAGYTDWQTDKVWLASATEVFSLWGVKNIGETWVRSGSSSNYFCSGARYLTAAGGNSNENVNLAHGVRPALHLNLTAAANSVKSRTDGAEFTAVSTPTDLEFTYDGKEYTSLAAVITRVEDGMKASPADASGDANSKGKITWYDEKDHPVEGNGTGTTANTIYKSGSTLAYKIEYEQGSVDANGNSDSGKAAVTLTEFKIKNAGVYTVTCYFENATTMDYQWRDIKTGAMSSSATTTFKIIVKQLEVKYKWKSSGGKLNETSADATKQWKVSFDKDKFTPDLTVNPTATSQAPWVYLDYTLLKDNGIADNVNAALITYDQTKKKSILGKNTNGSDKYDDTFPCIVVKYTNTEGYDNLIDNIYVNKNGTTAPVNGTSRAFPQEAGNYTVNAEDINAKTSNYKLKPADGEVALTTSTSSATRGYEIEKQEVNAPIKPASPLEYNGDEQKYRVADYDDKYMEYGVYDATQATPFTKDAMPTDSSGNDLGMTAHTTDTADKPLTLKATNANNYNIAFRLLSTTVESTSSPYHTTPLVRNYKWKSASTTDKDVAGKLVNGSSNVIEVNYAILPKTLEFDFHSSVKNSSGNDTYTIKLNNTDGKLTYSYKASASPVTPTGATGPEKPVLELYYKVADSTGSGSINPNTTAPTEFLYKDLKDSTGKHTTGKYVIYVSLADSKTNPVNKNYCLKDVDALVNEMTAAGASTSDIESSVKAAKATFEKEITITAGEASLNDLPIVYKEGNAITNSDAPAELSFDYTNKKNLQYKLGSDGTTPVPYWIYFNLDDDFSFLEVVGAISYQYVAPATDTSVCTYDPYGVIAGGSTTGSFPMCYAGKLTITVKIKVKDSEKASNKLPTQSAYDALNTAATPNKFTYTAGTPDSDGNVYDGELVFTYEIRKAEVDETAIADTTLLQWKYSTDDNTKWKDYTATSYPEYNEIALVDFRINPSKYNTDGNGTIKGVTATSLDSITNAAGQPEKQGPGTRYVTIAYTVDENNYEKVNYTSTTLAGKYKYTVEISPKIIDSSDLTLITWKDTDGVTDKTNSLGVPYQIWELNLPDPTFANFIEYEYYLYDPATSSVGTLIGKGDAALNDLTDPNGPYAYLNIDAGSSAYIYVKPVINLSKVDKVNGEPKYALKDLSGNTDKDVDGNDGYKKFEFGKQMTVIKVELQKTESEYGTAFTAADIIKITMGGSVAAESTYNTVVYKDKIDKDNIVGDLASFCTNSATLDAGKYIIKVTAVNGDLFVAVPATVNFTITPKEIELPTLGEMVFTGSGLNLADFLGGSWDPAAMTLGGDYEDIRNVGKTAYTATITLKNANYCWKYDGNDKVVVGYSVSDYEINQLDASTAIYKWNIAPLVVDTTNMWNKGKNGATLNLPQKVKDLIAGGTLEVGYRYYDSDGQFVENPEIKGGKSFKVEAVFGGDDAERNVQFKTGDTTLGSISPAVNYTVPQSGIAAFGGKVLSFLKNYWWWLLIALAILILLIILIVVLVKRRKNKEEREEKKRQKEEEKERREEEKRRREEEREAERERQRAELEAEKERQKAELELAKAKQEAELAKMKAEAAAAAGIAATAVAEQPKQEVAPAPVQQPQPQVQYVQQQPAVDPNALARLEAEMAAMRAENKAMHQSMQQQQQMPMAQPMMMPMQQPMMQMPMQMPMQQPMMPMMQPSYGPMPQQMPAYGGADNGALARVEAQINMLQAQQRAKDEAEHRAEMSAMRAEMRATKEAEQTAEFAALRNQMLHGNNANAAQPMAVQQLPAQPQQANNNNPNSMDMLGALVVAALKNIAEPKTAESKVVEQRIVEVEPPVAVNTPTVYPPDAVVTTTTRVDTTKPQQPRSRDDGRLFDVDGFYDSFEDNK